MTQIYREKAMFHVKRAEHWQALVLAHEKEALIRAPLVVQGRHQRADAVLTDEYVAKTLLRDHHGYNTAVANRNAHQAQANMYALLAQLYPDE